MVTVPLVVKISNCHNRCYVVVRNMVGLRAFDTIHQEGQRRFMESLSSYACQFLGQLSRPKVERISGLSPTICIDQKKVSVDEVDWLK